MDKGFDIELPSHLAGTLYPLFTPDTYTAIGASHAPPSAVASSSAWVTATHNDPERAGLHPVLFHVEHNLIAPVLVTEYRVIAHTGESQFTIQRSRVVPNDSQLADYLMRYARATLWIS